MRPMISPRARRNVNGVPFARTVNLTHPSDLRTMQEIFRTRGPFLGDAANAADLSDCLGGSNSTGGRKRQGLIFC